MKRFAWIFGRILASLENAFVFSGKNRIGLREIQKESASKGSLLLMYGPNETMAADNTGECFVSFRSFHDG